jgi:beta-lactamase class C
LIPSFQNSISSNPIKISHLLSHSSGLSGEGVDDLIESGLSREKIIAQIREKVDEADPGKMFSYHNVAYGLIGDLIETTSGYSFEEALKHLLATPLNMNAIGIGFDALMKNEDRAHPHVQHEKDTFVSATQYSTAYYAFPSSAGVHASLEDLTAFLQLYLGKYSHILSAESIQELTTPRIEASHLKSWYPSSHKDKIGEIAYGFGWQLMTFSQRKLICHGGWLDGFVSFLAFMPERDVGIVILTNAECDFASELGLDFFDMLCSY